MDPFKDLSLWLTGRRSSTTEVGNQQLDQAAIDMNNRWQKVEQSKGAEPALAMRELYTQIESSLETQLRYLQIL